MIRGKYLGISIVLAATLLGSIVYGLISIFATADFACYPDYDAEIKHRETPPIWQRGERAHLSVGKYQYVEGYNWYDCKIRSFMRFNISGLKPYRTIKAVKLRVSIDISGANIELDIHPYGNNPILDPEQDNDSIAYSRCSPSGDPYINDNTEIMSGYTTKVVDLGEQVCRDLEEARKKGSTFTLGFHEEGDYSATPASFKSVDHSIAYKEEDYPQLQVTYHPIEKLVALYINLAVILVIVTIMTVYKYRKKQ